MYAVQERPVPLREWADCPRPRAHPEVAGCAGPLRKPRTIPLAARTISRFRHARGATDSVVMKRDGRGLSQADSHVLNRGLPNNSIGLARLQSRGIRAPNADSVSQQTSRAWGAPGTNLDSAASSARMSARSCSWVRPAGGDARLSNL